MVKKQGETARSVYVPRQYEGVWGRVAEAMKDGEKMSTIVGEALVLYWKKRDRARAKV